MGATDKVRGKSDKITEIGLLLYPGAQAAAVAGLTDLFLVANPLSAERGGPRARAAYESLARERRGKADCTGLRHA
jgi:transcriptional regulator GlxA family with amidase domain